MKKRSFCSIAGIILFCAPPVYADQLVKIPLTSETSRLISEGKIRLEGGKVDSLLYKGKILDPNADDDGDGLVNASEIYTYIKDGRTYYGYVSHPLLYDTDGDGANDKVDSHPLVWDVSVRDMVMFMELVYRDDNYIRQVLDETKDLQNLYENRLEYSMMHKELSKFWKVKEIYHLSGGFDAVLFETRSVYPYLANNTVQVLGIRGTKGGMDLDDDIDIYFGSNPGQAKVLDDLLQKLNTDPSIHNLYATGHSLGGYLAQRGLIEASNKGYNWYKKAYTFNAPKIKGSIFHKWLYGVADKGNQLTKEGKAVHYIVNNDNVISRVGTFEGAINVGSSANGHGSRTYFETLVNDLPGFHVDRRYGMNGSGYEDDNLKNLRFDTVTDNQVYTEIRAIPEVVHQGEAVDLTDNISGLPEGSRVEVIEQVSSETAGTFEGKVKVIFKDGSSRIVSVPVTVKSRIAAIPLTPIPEIKPEQITAEVVYQGEAVDLTDNISGLPEGSRVEVIEQVSSETAGTFEGKVKVIFKDGSSRIVSVPVTVKSRSAAIPLTPIPEIKPEQIKAEVVYQGDAVDLTDNISGLPEGSRVEVIKPVSSETAGDFEGKVKVIFKDGSSRIVSVPVTVKSRSAAIPLTPIPEIKPEQITAEVVYQGDAVDLTDNISGLPEGSRVEVIKPVSSETAGDFEGKVKVIFKDGSSRIVSVPVTVKSRSAAIPLTPTPEIKPEQITAEVVYQGDAVDLTDNISGLPEGSRVEVIKQISSERAGDFEGKVKVIFKDGSSRIVTVPVTVKSRSTAIPLTPIPEIKPEQIKAEVVYQGDAVDLTDNISGLPEGSRVEVIEPVSSETAGDFEGKVKVIFKNGSSRNVSVPVTVKSRNAAIPLTPIPEIKPEQIKAEVVYQGETVNLTDNISGLPEGSRVEVIEPVSSETTGDFEGKVKVIFKNGLSRTVSVPVTVKSRSGAVPLTPISEIKPEQKLPELGSATSNQYGLIAFILSSLCSLFCFTKKGEIKK